MEKRILLEIAILLMLGLLWTPTFAWVHTDGSQDVLCECYGPRADKLLIHLYEDDTAEWAALKAGDIDITDWPLSKTVYQELKQWPYNETIQVVNYGPEFGLFILDLNSNNNQCLGNPPDPAYPNPVADNDDAIGNWAIKDGDGAANNHNPMSSVYMRRAIAYLIDRPGLIADPAIGTDFGYPMYTTMPPALTKYLLNVYGDPTMPWAWKYDPEAANATLEEGDFKINPATGYRYWDLDDDDTEDPDEWVELIFYMREDHPSRQMIGTKLIEEMVSVKLRVNRRPHTSSMQASVMIEKNFHVYTGGWSLGVDPDHLILWSWDYYWHPGFCYNYAGYNDPEFNEAAKKIMSAANQEEAVMYAMMAQEAQARNVLGVPLYCASGNKAFYKTNTGGNPGDLSEGEEWVDSFVNKLGYGIDNSWTFMNMHTGDTSYGGGMMIDWGFMRPEIKQLNPIYASWLYDWNVLCQVYESLLVRSPSDLGELLPWIAKDYDVSTYTHATYGECTKVVFTLREDVMWSDGTPLTVADVHFTFVELWEIISRRGLPPRPFYRSPIVDFSIIDAFSFEVLLDVKSYWGVGWVGSSTILPKHIWKPIAETGDPQADMPDPTLTGSGPWKFVEYNTEARYVLLDANPTFHRCLPLASNVKINPENRYKFTPEAGSPIIVTLENLCQRGCIDCLDVNIMIRHPNATDETYQYVNLTIDPGENLNFTFPITWVYGMYQIHISSTMHASSDDQWYLYSCSRSRVYVTIKEDIAGSSYYDDVELPSYPYKGQLPTPDFKVDIKDLAIAAKAFGSYPSHERWDPRVDINDDYKVDIRDLAAFARKFGFNCK